MTIARRRPGRVAFMAALLLTLTRLASAEAPAVTVWYRGTPAGVPRQDDLALIRSLGFTAVSWPTANTAALPALRQFARTVGLQIVTEPDGPAVTSAAVVRLADRVRIRVERARPVDVPALAWRAVAAGSRLISFDAGQTEGHGLADATGQERPWVRPAIEFARQVSVNAPLFEGMTPGPAVTVSKGGSPDTTVALFAATRIWVLIAANTGRDARELEVRFPAEVPYALWTSLVDGDTMSMLADPAGPRWTVQLGGGAAAVYFADR
jgi:hypothetical protein